MCRSPSSAPSGLQESPRRRKGCWFTGFKSSWCSHLQKRWGLQLRGPGPEPPLLPHRGKACRSGNPSFWGPLPSSPPSSRGILPQVHSLGCGKPLAPLPPKMTLSSPAARSPCRGALRRPGGPHPPVPSCWGKGNGWWRRVTPPQVQWGGRTPSEAPHVPPLQSCPEGARDFRAEQCSQFDSQDFQGRWYKWLPYYGGEWTSQRPHPCCRAQLLQISSAR